MRDGPERRHADLARRPVQVQAQTSPTWRGRGRRRRAIKDVQARRRAHVAFSSTARTPRCSRRDRRGDRAEARLLKVPFKEWRGGRTNVDREGRVGAVPAASWARGRRSPRAHPRYGDTKSQFRDGSRCGSSPHREPRTQLRAGPSTVEGSLRRRSASASPADDPELRKPVSLRRMERANPRSTIRRAPRAALATIASDSRTASRLRAGQRGAARSSWGFRLRRSPPAVRPERCREDPQARVREARPSPRLTSHAGTVARRSREDQESFPFGVKVTPRIFEIAARCARPPPRGATTAYIEAGASRQDDLKSNFVRVEAAGGSTSSRKPARDRRLSMRSDRPGWRVGKKAYGESARRSTPTSLQVPHDAKG